MILESFPVGPIACNCTILGDENSHEALLVDPGAEAQRIQRRLAELGLTVKQILLTHAHIDHVGAAWTIKQATNAPIFLNENDLELLQMIDTQATWLGIAPPEVGLPDEGLDDGQTVGLEHYPAKVLYTPGHSRGSVCLYFADQKLLLSGDTLFAGSVGRTDLPGGDSSQIIQSIHAKLLPLPDDTTVIPGHGPGTTIGEERIRNPYLRTEI